MNSRLRMAAILGMIAVILGALGSHALKERLGADALASFEVGVRYQMIHALMILAIEGNSQLSEQSKRIVSRFVLIGVIAFSGSIYLLSTREITCLEVSFLGPITPIGGLFLISAWGYLIFKSVTYSPR
jgi:uncharacterized membrane protein YgdD (TMEM256/DUF423 family)